VRSIEIEYFKPALLDDLLNVTVTVTETGRSRITVFQEIICNHVKLVSATIHVVCVGAETLKPVRIPAPLREKIGKFA
jgi:acyl-CoA thioester hydrolase